MSAADRDDDGELTAHNNRRYLNGGAADGWLTAQGAGVDSARARERIIEARLRRSRMSLPLDDPDFELVCAPRYFPGRAGRRARKPERTGSQAPPA